MIILVNPPTLWELEDLDMVGKLSCFELQGQHVSPSALKSFPGEHLGLQSLAAGCRALELPVTIVNAQVLLHRSLDETWQTIVERAGGATPDVVGFSGPAQVFKENVALARRTKEQWPETTTVIGADFATLNGERILRDYDVFDAVVDGEAEEAFPSLCTEVLAGRDPTGIPRVVTRENSATVRVPPQLLDLDELPWIARDDTRAVMNLGLSAGVFSTRGCPYRCTFCTTGQLTARNGRLGYREKSVENVVDEIEYLAKDYAIDYITITDDLFVTKSAASQARARSFAKAYAARGLSSIPFMIDCRVDSMEHETLAALRKAGLHRIFVGIESGSQETLEAYDKTYGRRAMPEFIAAQLRIAADLGIDVVPGIITYHPGVTVPELRTTLEVVDAVGYRGSFQFLNKVFAHPGTPLWHTYAAQGVLDPDWPVPHWRFQNADAEEVAADVFAAAAEGRDFDGIRTALIEAIEKWESRQHAPVPA